MGFLWSHNQQFVCGEFYNKIKNESRPRCPSNVNSTSFLLGPSAVFPNFFLIFFFVSRLRAVCRMFVVISTRVWRRTREFPFGQLSTVYVLHTICVFLGSERTTSISRLVEKDRKTFYEKCHICVIGILYSRKTILKGN